MERKGCTSLFCSKNLTSELALWKGWFSLLSSYFHQFYVTGQLRLVQEC